MSEVSRWSDTLCASSGDDSSVHGEKVKTGKSHQSIDDSGNPGHIAAEERDQVKAEKSDQSPVYGSYKGNGQRSVIQT